MSIRPEDLAKRVLRREWQQLSADERHVIESVLAKTGVAREATALGDERRTLGERLADRIAMFGGSWTFILNFLVFLAVWAFLNTEILGPRREAFDPYPYIFLNLFLSMLAALQAPIIMMAQNRQTTRDRIDAQNDYRVNLSAELQIRAVHEKLDELRDTQWGALVQLQHDQIELLRALIEQRPAPPDVASRPNPQSDAPRTP